MSPYDIKTCPEHPSAAHRVLPFVDDTVAEVECMKCHTLIPQGPPDATYQPEEWFCGCCGNEAPQGMLWCERCEGHVCVGFPPWECTYESLTGKPCPYQV